MISQYLGFDSDYIIIGLAALVLILIILMMLGRIGSVTVLSALFSDKSKITSKLAQEKIQIG